MDGKKLMRCEDGGTAERQREGRRAGSKEVYAAGRVWRELEEFLPGCLFSRDCCGSRWTEAEREQNVHQYLLASPKFAHQDWVKKKKTGYTHSY